MLHAYWISGSENSHTEFTTPSINLEGDQTSPSFFVAFGRLFIARVQCINTNGYYCSNRGQQIWQCPIHPAPERTQERRFFICIKFKNPLIAQISLLTLKSCEKVMLMKSASFIFGCVYCACDQREL